MSTVDEDTRWRSVEQRCSTGVRIAVDEPSQNDMLSEFEITEDIRREGKTLVVEFNDDTWGPFLEHVHDLDDSSLRTVRQIEIQNKKLRKENARLESENAKLRSKPRECEFNVAPINAAVPFQIIDYWIAAANPLQPISAEINFHSEVTLERQIEAISAKIHGSDLSLRDDGTLLWLNSVVATLDKDNRKANLGTTDREHRSIADFRIPELVRTLFDLNILSLPSQKLSKRRR